jgi:NADH-quinone oxidoreductase subunit E
MFGPEFERKADAVVARYPRKRSAVLPLLHMCQKEEGHVSPRAEEWIGQRLELSPAYVHGVTTFYTLFHTRPPGEHVIWVCTSLSCMLRGCDKVMDHLETRLGVKLGGTTADGRFTLLNNECLGSCGTAPMMQVDDDYYEDLDLERVDEIVDALTRGEKPTPGPAAERAFVE